MLGFRVYGLRLLSCKTPGATGKGREESTVVLKLQILNPTLSSTFHCIFQYPQYNPNITPPMPTVKGGNSLNESPAYRPRGSALPSPEPYPPGCYNSYFAVATIPIVTIFP